jgi:plastocyanin
MRIHRLAMILIVPFAVAALALSSCGSDNNNGITGVGGHLGIGGFGGNAAGAGGAGGTGGSDAGTAAAGAEISIQNFTFVPANLTVAPGTTITVHNTDTVQHTVTSQSAPRTFVPGSVAGVSFDTGLIAPGGTATFTIPANAPSGTVIPYFCANHTVLMRDDPTITVQ